MYQSPCTGIVSEVTSWVLSPQLTMLLVESTFAELLRSMRQARGMGQLRLAELSHLSKGYIGMLETGQRGRRPSRETITALVQALRATDEEKISLLKAAGRFRPEDTEDSRPRFINVVMTDPLLRQDQKRALIAAYESYVGRVSSGSGQ